MRLDSLRLAPVYESEGFGVMRRTCPRHGGGVARRIRRWRSALSWCRLQAVSRYRAENRVVIAVGCSGAGSLLSCVSEGREPNAKDSRLCLTVLCGCACPGAPGASAYAYVICFSGCGYVMFGRAGVHKLPTSNVALLRLSVRVFFFFFFFFFSSSCKTYRDLVILGKSCQGIF